MIEHKPSESVVYAVNFHDLVLNVNLKENKYATINTYSTVLHVSVQNVKPSIQSQGLADMLGSVDVLWGPARRCTAW